MSYKKELINGATMPVIKLEEKKLYEEYELLGSGAEGEVFKIANDLAFKKFYLKNAQKKLKYKYKKIELLSKLNDPSFNFPLGLCTFGEFKEGYYMPFIKTGKFKNLDEIFYKSNNVASFTKYIIKISNALQRLHQMGITVGDVRCQNILIQENDEPIFIDTDSYAIGEFDYDLDLRCTKYLFELYHKEYSYEDIDKFLLAIISIQPFLEGTVIEAQIRLQRDDMYFKNLINLMQITKEDKEALREILSDSYDKPYIGPILERINPKSRLFKFKDAPKINL